MERKDMTQEEFHELALKLSDEILTLGIGQDSNLVLTALALAMTRIFIMTKKLNPELDIEVFYKRYFDMIGKDIIDGVESA